MSGHTASILAVPMHVACIRPSAGPISDLHGIAGLPSIGFTPRHLMGCELRFSRVRCDLSSVSKGRNYWGLEFGFGFESATSRAALSVDIIHF
ncbi:uncharacterized protein Dsimw501_GD26866 [Drosophila simulans]|uniref:Uncharacterized protein n=1 Tax=Drosophila simulans TaxID=7240 RepID=A0A0J9R2A6_DROSI|nr:uncharacterized protein Dsimw501_GD26866 [Drosophila simulans]